MSIAAPGPFVLARIRPAPEPPMFALSSESPSQSYEAFSTTHALTLILTVLLLVLFFVGFFSIYFCRCFVENIMTILNHRGRSPMGAPVNPSNPDPPGLDPEIIESFPAFEYSSVKDFRRETYGLECAICLSEFQDDDSLRLIPECCHVFHKDCIDLWLASHKSCPVCRRGLDPAADDPPNPEDDGPGPLSRPGLDPTRPDIDIEARGRPDDDGASYSITVMDDEDRKCDRSPVNLEKSVIFYEKGRFSRSHSTGHSIVRMNEDERAAAGAATGEDKYTLRLPDHVKEKITRGHVQTLSCTTFGDMSRESANGRNCFGEISGSYTNAKQ